MELLRGLQPGDGMVFMCFGSDKGSRDQVVQLVKEFGHTKLLLRMMGNGIPKEDPAEWAAECELRAGDVWARMQQQGVDCELHVIPGNEMNLVAEEGGHKGWKKHARWLETFYIAWKTQGSGALLHIPAPSRQVSDAGNNEAINYWQAIADIDLQSNYDYIDVHGYVGDVWLSVQECLTVFAGPAAHPIQMWLTETNRHDMADIENGKRKGVIVGADWFSSAWRVYDEHGGVVDEPHPGDEGFTLDRNPDVASEFRALADGGPGIDSPGDPPTPPEPPVEPEPVRIWSREEMIDEIIQRSEDEGLPWTLLLACGIAESNLNQYARRPTDAALDDEYWPDVSMGAFQQTVRYAAGYTDGDEFPGADVVTTIGNRYYDFEYALEAAVPQLKYWWNQEHDVVNALCRYNWPARDPLTNPNRQNYLRGFKEAQDIIAAKGHPDEPQVPPAETFDSETPLILQPNDWACSACSLAMALSSIGRPTDWWEARMMLGERVNPDVGLTDASGAGLAQTIIEQGLSANYRSNADPISWGELVDIAGDKPIMLGGTAWNHWVFVRSYDESTGEVRIGNPSPTWHDAGQELTQTEFDALGPFSTVWIDTQAVPEDHHPVDPSAGLITALAFVCDNLGDTLEQIVNADLMVYDQPGVREEVINVVNDMRRVREQTLGPRPS